MKCPKCKRKMLLNNENHSYNLNVNPKVKYKRSTYWCKKDDIWLLLEMPVSSKK